jgi:hypothetical protein
MSRAQRRGHICPCISASLVDQSSENDSTNFLLNDRRLMLKIATTRSEDSTIIEVAAEEFSENLIHHSFNDL